MSIKDIEQIYSAYNLVVSMLPTKNNYVNNLINKRVIKIEYKKENLSQVNPQLHESLSIFNEKFSKNIVPNSNANVNGKFDSRGNGYIGKSMSVNAKNANISWQSPDLKKHKLFKENGFENFRGRVGIDNVIFNYIIRSGKAKWGDVFYDINLEVDQYLPHTKDADASDIKGSTSDGIIPSSNANVNGKFANRLSLPQSFATQKTAPSSDGAIYYKVSFYINNAVVENTPHIISDILSTILLYSF